MKPCKIFTWFSLYIIILWRRNVSSFWPSQRWNRDPEQICCRRYDQISKWMVEFLSKFLGCGIKIARFNYIHVAKPLIFFNICLPSNFIIICRFLCVELASTPPWSIYRSRRLGRFMEAVVCFQPPSLLIGKVWVPVMHFCACLIHCKVHWREGSRLGSCRLISAQPLIGSIIREFCICSVLWDWRFCVIYIDTVSIRSITACYGWRL